MTAWDSTMKSMFDEIDRYLEDKYKNLYPLHPNRPKEGATCNPEMDGLFNVGAGFSAGYGSKLGRGYVVDIHLSTLSSVETNLKSQIENDVMAQIKEKLPLKFPQNELNVSRDGNLIKIYGDLSLDSF